jgi:hypothetical protein
MPSLLPPALSNGYNIFLIEDFFNGLLSELLNLLALDDLCHAEIDHCLFDDCVDRATIKDAIEKSWICEKCMAKLKGGVQLQMQHS